MIAPDKRREDRKTGAYQKISIAENAIPDLAAARPVESSLRFLQIGCQIDRPARAVHRGLTRAADQDLASSTDESGDLLQTCESVRGRRSCQLDFNDLASRIRLQDQVGFQTVMRSKERRFQRFAAGLTDGKDLFDHPALPAGADPRLREQVGAGAGAQVGVQKAAVAPV